MSDSNVIELQHRKEQAKDLQVIEYKGVRVLTTQQIANAYDTEHQVIVNNFNRNKDRYEEGKHFICLIGEDLKEFRAKNQNDVLPNANRFYLWTEKGTFLHAKSLNTDTAWEVYDRLVESYFRVRNLVNEELSPNLQLMQTLLNQMIEQEKTANEAKRLAQQAVDTTDSIKEAVKPIFDNWREEMNKKFNRIQQSCGSDFKILRTEMYKELDRRAGCDIHTRLRNQKQRMCENGHTKTAIEKLNKMDVIEQDKRLREIFSKIVSEYEIRYCA